MSIQIDGLSGAMSLIETIEASFPPLGYIEVGRHERIRVSVYCSCIIKVQLEWSHDGVRTGPISAYRCGSNMWKCDLVDVLMPYLRIHVINESGRPCDDLVVHVWSPFVKQEVVEEKVEPAKNLVSRFLPQKRNSVSPRLHDDRLPDFIPQGSLLVGGDKGKITFIPKGNVGEYLMMGELGPTYRLPYPPTKLNEVERSKLESWN